MELHSIHLTDAQKRKLLRRQPVQLKNENLQGNHKIVLNHEQSVKIRRAKRTGKGIRLQLHNDELVHNNVVHGTGFKELLSKAKKAVYHGAHMIHNHLQETGVYDNIKQTGKRMLKEKLNDATAQLKDAVHNRLDNNKYANYIPEHLKQNLHNIADQQINTLKARANNHIDAYGEAPIAVQGEGFGKTERFFRDTGRAIVGAAKSKVGKQILKGVVKTALPLALNAVSAETGVPLGVLSQPLTNVANNQIDGLGLKKKKIITRRRGAGLFPSGY
jgi:hypothetical protein